MNIGSVFKTKKESSFENFLKEIKKNVNIRMLYCYKWHGISYKMHKANSTYSRIINTDSYI